MVIHLDIMDVNNFLYMFDHILHCFTLEKNSLLLKKEDNNSRKQHGYSNWLPKAYAPRFTKKMACTMYKNMDETRRVNVNVLCIHVNFWTKDVRNFIFGASEKKILSRTPNVLL
jgi:hypothetical protein